MIIKKALITLCVLSVIVVPSSAQQPAKQQRPSMEYISPPAKPSSIPIYKFGETLEEQEKQLAVNPYLKRLHKARAKPSE